MLRLFALTTFAINPAAYYTMKAAAIGRHIQVRKLEGDAKGALQDTWHETLIEWVYPI